jgi:acetoin utilization protein AcuB
MTRQPCTIERGQNLNAAHHLMRTHRVRHLPVMEGGKLVGIVSERDLHLMETLPDVDPEEVMVEDAMTDMVFVAEPADEVAEVVDQMAERKLGSVVVMTGGQVEGIFTSIDALQVLSDVLRRTVDPR